jgi:putative oxidoreductase
MTKSQHIALLILRVMIAIIFVHAAYPKLMLWSGTPEGVSAGLATIMKLLSIVEPLGATAVLIGFLTRWAASGLAIILVGAIFVSQFIMHIGFATPTGPGWAYPFAVLGGCIALIAFGAGRWSVDAKRARSAGTLPSEGK